MRERAQASVETIGLMVAAVALAAAVTFGVVRLGPPFASVLRGALSGVVSPGAATAPGLDGLERALLAGATSAEADGPTMLDVRTHLRSRLDRGAADAAFAAILKPLVDRALDETSIDNAPREITLVDRASEDAWVLRQLHPGRSATAAKVAAEGIASIVPVLALVGDLAIGQDRPADGIYPGHAAGDVVVRVDDDGAVRNVVLRRRAGSGFAVVAMFDPRGAPVAGR